MNLLILRHGTAEIQGLQGDFSRELVEKGREQARRAARLLKFAGLLPDVVLTSPLVRAKQTAEEFSKEAGMPGPLVQSWLASGMTPITAITELSAFNDFRRVVIVGHEPDLSELINWILGATEGGVRVKKGALISLQISPPLQQGLLEFLIPSKFSQEASD